MIKILLDNKKEYRTKARYVFETFFEIIGVPVMFIEDKGSLRKEDVLICYGKNPIKGDFPVLAMPEGDWSEGSGDVIAESFYLLSRHEELVNKNRDCWGCFPADFSISYKQDTLRLPVVNNYIEGIRQALERLSGPSGNGFKPVARWKDNKRFAAVLTHDVDNLNKYTSENGLKMLIRGKPDGIKVLARSFLGAGTHDPYWSFDDFMAAERAFGATSTFFIVPESRNRKYDPRYRLDRALRYQLRAIREKGWDIGLHGSYDSFIDEDMLKRQKVMLENALDSRITGVRQHYLRFSAQDTPPVQEKAGFLYDSTLGYNEDIGFRAGLAAPFFVYDNKNRKKSNILELPLAVMDGSLFLSRRYTNQEAFNKVKELIDGVEAVGGLIVFLWHNKARDTQDFPGWWETYLSILEYLHGRKAWMTNASQLAEWWVDRIKTCAV